MGSCSSETKFHGIIISPTWQNNPKTTKLINQLFTSLSIFDSIHNAGDTVRDWENKREYENQINQLNNTQEKEAYILFTDYSFPDSDISGFELLKFIKNTPNLKHIHVVIMCFENDQWRSERCIENGVLDCIVRPLTPEKAMRIQELVLQVEGTTVNGNDNNRNENKINHLTIEVDK